MTPPGVAALCLLACTVTEALILAEDTDDSRPRQREVAEYGLPPCMAERLKKTVIERLGSESDPMLREAGLDGIYICHWKKLQARRKSAEEQLAMAGLSAELITGWDSEELTDDDVRCMYPDNTIFDALAKKLKFAANWFHTGELSLSIKHVAAAYETVKHGHRNALVLEDDFTLVPNFTTKLSTLLRGRDSWLKGMSYDILWIGSYSHNHPVDLGRPPTTYADPVSKGTVGYVLSQEGARYILAHMPITTPADHMLGNSECGTAPPHRWTHRPWLVEPKDDFGTTQGLATPKRSHFIRTPDIVDCAGTKCPCTKPRNVTAQLIQGGCCCKASAVP